MRKEPYAHQRIGIDEIVKWDDPAKGRVVGGVFYLGDEMGAGKTKQTIDAAQVLYTRNELHRVIVVCPNGVRPVWYDPELGQLAEHLWTNVASRVFEFHTRVRSWDFGPNDVQKLKWVITNYDYIRRPEHLAKLLAVADKKTMLVIDESSAIKNHRALQTKAVLKLRAKCGRVLELNGTPVPDTPLDLFSQMNVLDKRILGCDFWQFRARYAKMGGWKQKEIVGWIDLDDLQRRIAPYMLRRLKKDCLDLPEKLPSVAITVPMSESSWRIYKEMRDDMVTWLSSCTVSMAQQAIVKIMRLAQVTSGFIGGLEEDEDEQSEMFEDRPDWVDTLVDTPRLVRKWDYVGREKLDAFVQWWQERMAVDPKLKLLVWCRFRPELQRLAQELETNFPHVRVGKIWGGQKPAERQDALKLLDPRTAPDGPVTVFGITDVGRTGLNLTAAHNVLYMSNGPSLFTREQSEDRVHRPGQRNVVSYYDMIATGPQGQKTIDHIILRALREKQSLAQWTTSAWVTALKGEAA